MVAPTPSRAVEGFGIDHVLNSSLLAGEDVSHVRITRLARNPAHH
jgi:hypothetical protein